MQPTVDGYYWYRIYINLPGGGNVDQWKLGKVIGRHFQCWGTVNLIPLDCPYLKRAIWSGPVEPPPIQPVTSS